MSLQSFRLTRLFPDRKRKRRLRRCEAPRRRRVDEIRRGEAVIAVEFAHDLDDAVHRPRFWPPIAV